MSEGASLPGIEAAPRRPRGRPKGATNKRQGDLARYVEAVHGATPGEQLAKVGLVTRAEVKAAGGDVVAALVVKAQGLAAVLGCSAKEAWDLIADARSELMAYVHQKQPQAIAVKGSGFAPAVLVVGTELPSQLAPMEEAEDVEFQPVSAALPDHVSRPKSHDEVFPLFDQGVDPGRATDGE